MSAPPQTRPLDSAMRQLLAFAGVLVALAGLQLFVFTEQTDRYFAWTIDPPLTAAFLGASYWSSVAFEWSATRRTVWADARISVPTVFAFTLLTLGATLIHIENFHLGPEFEATTRAVTWAWIAIYAVVPVLLVIVTVRQSRLPGGDPPRIRPLPIVLRAAVGVQAVVLLVLGTALFVAPESASAAWPWALTPLTGRAVGAWVASMGVAAAHALWENDAVRLRPAAVAYLTFGLFQAVALARFPGDMEWESAPGIGYLLFLVVTIVIGAWALQLGRSQGEGAAGSAVVT